LQTGKNENVHIDRNDRFDPEIRRHDSQTIIKTKPLKCTLKFNIVRRLVNSNLELQKYNNVCDGYPADDQKSVVRHREGRKGTEAEVTIDKDVSQVLNAATLKVERISVLFGLRRSIRLFLDVLVKCSDE
jgi:hypothetical protein